MVFLERQKPEAWKPLDDLCREVTDHIEEIAIRVEKLSSLYNRTDNLKQLRVLLSLQSVASYEQAKLPCIMLPAAKNARFFDRDNIIGRIESHFTADAGRDGPHSLALYGLGGVGKSHVALKYAHRKSDELQAIFWVYSETAAALEQSFTDIAVRLQFEGVEPARPIENKIQVLNWLQQTSIS